MGWHRVTALTLSWSVRAAALCAVTGAFTFITLYKTVLIAWQPLLSNSDTAPIAQSAWQNLCMTYSILYQKS